MFEEYLKDSNEFYLIAFEAQKISDTEKARRYYRVSIMCVFNSAEAFVNYIAKSFEEANNLDRLEICFLTDKEEYFSPIQGIKTRSKYNPLDEKLKALVNRFTPNYDFGTSTAWSNFMEFKDFRDSLVHSRMVEDETNLSDYESKLRSGFKSIVEIMNLVSKGMYKKPLRKSIIDLVPD